MTLKDFFLQHPKIALGFSGGVDSSYLLYAARHYGADVQPYFVKGSFQPQFELEDAKKLADDLGVKNLKILACDILAEDKVAENNPLRCYYCKQRTFGLIAAAAKADGYEVILDGTNASDDPADRPGVKALQELQVLSPLALCGLTKEQIRKLSREAGLFTWNKPAYACLATRIPTGIRLTAAILDRVEKAEAELVALGFSDFRVRVLGEAAKVQIPAAQMENFWQQREEIYVRLTPYFHDVVLDLKAR